MAESPQNALAPPILTLRVAVADINRLFILNMTIAARRDKFVPNLLLISLLSYFLMEHIPLPLLPYTLVLTPWHVWYTLGTP